MEDVEEVVVNESPVIDEQEEVVEQPDKGTPEEDPEYALDEDGNLVWRDAEEESAEEDSEDETEEQPAEEEEETADDTEDGLPSYKVKVNGEELEVPLDELIAGYSRQSDYTRKMQELAEQRKQITTPPVPQTQSNQPADQAQQLSDIELAKKIASKRLGLESVDDLSELSFEHNVAVFEAKQAIDNQRRANAQKQMAINSMESELRQEDPAYDEILARVGAKIQDLPHKEFLKLQKAYENGDPAPLREYYKEERKAFYAEKVKSSVTPKKVPKVESSSNTPLQKQAKKIDFRTIGKMNSEQKAQMLIDMGLV